MFTTLKSFLEPLLPQAAPRAAFEHTLQVATAVLLVEVMRSDASIGLSERAAVIVALRDRFALNTDEVEALMVVADQTAREAHDLHTFTSRLNDQLEPEQKARIVEYMWQVAYADGPPRRTRAARDAQARGPALHPARRLHRREDARPGGHDHADRPGGRMLAS